MSRVKRILFALVTVALGLGLLELVSLAIEWLPYGAIRTEGRLAGLYLNENPGGPPRLRPGARLRGIKYQISINTLGFRGHEPDDPRPAGGLRVWCIGGSTTFDIYAPDDAATWPGQLQQLLLDALPGRRVEVINAGVPNEVLQGNIAALVRHYPRVQPDILVAYQGPNEIRRIRGPVPPPVLPPLMDHFALVRLVFGLIQQRPSAQGEFSGSVFPVERMNEAEAGLEELLATARRLGVQVVLATHALRLPPRYTATSARESLAQDSRLMALPPLEVARGFDAYNAMVQELARRRGLPLADIRRAVGPDPKYWGDATHFSAQGSRLAAREAARVILELLRRQGQ